jgi:hypothetical protein
MIEIVVSRDSAAVHCVDNSVRGIWMIRDPELSVALGVDCAIPEPTAGIWFRYDFLPEPLQIDYDRTDASLGKPRTINLSGTHIGVAR